MVATLMFGLAVLYSLYAETVSQFVLKNSQHGAIL